MKWILHLEAGAGILCHGTVAHVAVLPGGVTRSSLGGLEAGAGLPVGERALPGIVVPARIRGGCFTGRSIPAPP